jgi:S-adenosylmethionine:tRNA ribosyltransferase-isomerase
VRTEEFDYDLPADAIAQTAIEPRDAARLLVTSSQEDRRFRDLPGLLNPGDLVVVNRTRVRAARLTGHKPATGGAVELLLLRRLDADRWEALIRPARRIQPGIALDFGGIGGEVLSRPTGGVVTVRLSGAVGDVEDMLAEEGEIPLPPYFRGELDDPERYQTVFSKTVGSAAAPTAGLHFTPGVLAGLAMRGIDLAEVDLEVGLDTFRPMTVDDIESHQIHHERYEIPDVTVAAVAATRRRGGKVVAVGTTVIRALESGAIADGLVRAGRGEADLFIKPGYRLAVVDAAVTNFHAPRTTLIALVAAMLGPAWRDIYAAAVARGYRFLSFGDAMLIDRPVNHR